MLRRVGRGVGPSLFNFFNVLSHLPSFDVVAVKREHVYSQDNDMCRSVLRYCCCSVILEIVYV